MAHRIGHRQHRKPKGKRHTDEADADFREFRDQDGAAAASQPQLERADQLGGDFFR
jgi:hypothetical protein